MVLKVIDAGLKTAFQIVTFCDGDIDSTEIEGAFDRAADIYAQNVDIISDVAAHDTNIDADLAAHDADIKALLATIQSGIVENGQKLNQVINLLLTPQGLRPGFP